MDAAGTCGCVVIVIDEHATMGKFCAVHSAVFAGVGWLDFVGCERDNGKKGDAEHEYSHHSFHGVSFLVTWS
jgi:hypothetical protein